MQKYLSFNFLIGSAARL